MRKILFIFCLLNIISCADTSTMSSEKSEFERCIEANIEIFRDSPNLTILPDTALNLEFRIPIKTLEGFLELNGSAPPDSRAIKMLSKFYKSLEDYENKSDILAHFALLQSEGILNYLTQIHLENDGNTYFTLAYLPEYELEEEYYNQEIFFEMHFYSMCNLDSDTDRRICLLDDNSTFAEYFKYGSWENEVRTDVLFKTEQDFLNHFSNNKSWADYNALVNSTPTFTLRLLLETEPIDKADKFFEYALKSTLMSSTDDELYKFAKRICNSQGIY